MQDVPPDTLERLHRNLPLDLPVLSEVPQEGSQDKAEMSSPSKVDKTVTMLEKCTSSAIDLGQHKFQSGNHIT